MVEGEKRKCFGRGAVRVGLGQGKSWSQWGIIAPLTHLALTTVVGR